MRVTYHPHLPIRIKQTTLPPIQTEKYPWLHDHRRSLGIVVHEFIKMDSLISVDFASLAKSYSPPLHGRRIAR